ncbi:MAG: hypothetical protein EOO42_20390 [Flavobacteriales bacterium]|nr:MAG: hypothetical protein EOO42_20390 [Flavobacteriales bacterium]
MKNLKLILPVLAIILGLGIVLTQSAFKSHDAKRTVSYFKYTGSTFDETNYRNISNWEHVTDLEAPSCAGEGKICVLEVDNSNLTAPGTMIQKLDDYFNQQLDGTDEVRDYVEEPLNAQAQQN